MPRHTKVCFKNNNSSFLPHGFTFIILEAGIRMYLIISVHSLKNWPHLPINNSFSQPKSYIKERGKKSTTKRRLGNPVIKYEKETLFVYLVNQNRGCCSCRSLSGLMVTWVATFKNRRFKQMAIQLNPSGIISTLSPIYQSQGHWFSAISLVQIHTGPQSADITANQCYFAYHNLHFKGIASYKVPRSKI